VNLNFPFHVRVDWSSLNVSVLKAFYWGEICKKYRVKDSTLFHYDINFHDGDQVEGCRSKYFHRLEEVMKLVEAGWWNIKEYPPKEYLEDTINAKTPRDYLEDTINTKTPRELYEGRCKACSQCKIRHDCGQCSVCRQNKNADSRSTLQCCVQKVCL
jgi:hypothetical protein